MKTAKYNITLINGGVAVREWRTDSYPDSTHNDPSQGISFIDIATDARINILGGTILIEFLNAKN